MTDEQVEQLVKTNAIINPETAVDLLRHWGHKITLDHFNSMYKNRRHTSGLSTHHDGDGTTNYLAANLFWWSKNKLNKPKRIK
jgi:hypothetical protein